MGKKAAGAQPKAAAAAPEKKEPAPSQAAKKGKAAKVVANEEKPGLLSHIRPAPRSIFFLVFVTFCAGVCLFYDPCAVKGKRKDCGHPGITPGKCRSLACFLKGGGAIGKKTVKVKRKDGTALGLVLAKDKEGMIVEEVKAGGAVAEHNDGLPAGSQDLIGAGTRILMVDKAEGSSMTKEIEKTKNAKTVEIELRVNRVPSFLMWLENKGKPSEVEKILTSPGSQYFGTTWVFLAKIGAATWFVSGYGFASLPTYMTISAATSLYLARCCHNENVAQGEPHCYKGRRDPIMEVVQEAAGKVTALVDKVRKDPRSYFDSFFKPSKNAYSFLW